MVQDDILDDFCDTFMEPEMFDALEELSKLGSLGFQPIDGTVMAEHWHKAVFKSVYAYGAERMKKMQLKALEFFSREAIPFW